MSPADIPKLNLRNLVDRQNEMTDRRPYLPPRRVFVSVPPHKSKDPPDRQTPKPLTSSERLNTPPLISSPASLGPASPHVKSSPKKDGSRTAPTQVNYWNCLRKSAPFEQCSQPHSQAIQRNGHSRVRSAGAAVTPTGTVITKMHTQAGLLHTAEQRSIRNPYGFLLAGANVQTGLAQRDLVAASSNVVHQSSAVFAHESPLSLPLRSEGSSTVKTIKRRKESREQNWSNSLKGVHTGILRAEKTILASLSQVENRVMAHLDQQAKCVEDRLAMIERHLSTMRLCDATTKASFGAGHLSAKDSPESATRAQNNNAPTTCSTATAGLEEFQLCSDMNMRRGNSADTLFDNLSERNRSPALESVALVKATEGLTIAVSSLLQRIGAKSRGSDTDEDDFELECLSDESSGTSVKVMQVK